MSLAERATNLIQFVVYHSLVDISEPVGFDLVSNIADAFSQVDIFSLNHDLLIERQLEKDDKAYLDGFSKINGDFTLFNKSWECSNNGIRLFKLHGSVDWYLCRFKKVDQYAKLRGSPETSADSDGNLMNTLDVIPSFLTGTIVKEQDYGVGLYGELFYQFRKRLSSHNVIVFSGYGWGDKGINKRIYQWLRDNRENRILILDENGEEEVRKKRFWVFNWDIFKSEGKVQVIQKWFSDYSVDELFDALNATKVD